MDTTELYKKYTPMTETAFLILFSLKTPKHGYHIMEYTKKVTGNRILLGNGTLYGTLARMERDDLISVKEEADSKKIYEITEIGNQILENEENRILQLAHLISNKEGI